MRHRGGLLALTLVTSGLMLVPPSATAAPLRSTAVAVAARHSAPTRIRVVIRTARGVPATVRLTHGRQHHMVSKPARGERLVRRVRVTPGTWHLTGPAVLAKRRVWVIEARKKGDPYLEQRSADIRVRRHHTVTAQATWYEVPAARLWVARTTGSTASLRWRTPVKDVRFMVRRGDQAAQTAPQTVHEGALVFKGRASRATATGLESGQAYPFSVFVRNRGQHGDKAWAGPVSVRGTTSFCSVQTSLTVGDCQALLDIARANPNADLPAWWTGDPCKDWLSVLCAGDRVHQLMLDHTGLHRVPASISDLTDLRALSLGSNHVTSLPTSASSLPALTDLELGNNGLTSVPTGVKGLSHLGYLGLTQNHLGRLPGWLGHLTGLYDIDATNNRLSSLPDGLGNLSDLADLRLSNNRLTELPGWLGGLTHLSTLSVRGNRLRTVPNWIDRLPLHRLNLGANRLDRVPAAIGDLSHLQFLWIDHNALRRLPASFGNLTKVLHLNAGHNRLSGDISPWAGPLSRNGAIIRGSNSVVLTHNRCLNAGGDSELATWLDTFSHGWRSGC